MKTTFDNVVQAKNKC